MTGWKEYLQEVEPKTYSSAIFSNDGACCAESQRFFAQKQPVKEWISIFKDEKSFLLARQNGIAYYDPRAEIKRGFFAVEVSPTCIVGRRDNVFLILMKSRTLIVVALIDPSKNVENARAALRQTVDDLIAVNY